MQIFILFFQKQTSSIRELESKLRSHKNSAITSPVPKEEHDNLKRELTDQTKEIRILRRTVDEMDLRLETQKQTLAARDGSIKKLLEMLQSKGLAADKIEESQKELEKVRVEKIEDQKKLKQLQDSISAQDREITDLKEVGIHSRGFPRPDLGPNIGPSSQFKNEQKHPKKWYIILDFIVLHFGGNFMKIRTQIAKLQMHENLHKNVSENMFSFTFLCKLS